MVFAKSLLAITCLIKEVEWFAGPLWAAKFQENSLEKGAIF